MYMMFQFILISNLLTWSMVLMEPESSLLLSSPLTLFTEPLRLSELEAAREFFLFTADDDALPFRLLLQFHEF